MTPWKCAGCGCEYSWNEPNKKNGAKFCDTCIDDPEAVNNARAVTSHVGGGWWFALGILLGMMLAKILFCNH